MVLEAMQALHNVRVRFSPDAIDGTYTDGLHGSVIVPDASFNTDATLCRAYDSNEKCNGCRACYDKDIPVIAYPARGVKMKKVIRLSVQH